MVASCCAAASWCSTSSGQSNAAEIGFSDLVTRLGAVNVPTGAGVVLAQVEGSESAGNFGPNMAFSEFVGKVFMPMSGSFGSSVHATTVGQFGYGNSSSIAPGITNILVYEAGNWAQTGFLRFNQGEGAPPLVPPNQTKIINNSWGGSFGNPTSDNEVLRRADFQVDRDDTIMVNPPANNIQAELPLMGNTFNGISVGLTSGSHLPGPTPSNLDGPGRQRPNIVAPGEFTSYAAPVVSATAALLIQTARTFPGLLANPNAQRAETIKAVILAGARKRAGWTNLPATSGAGRGVTSTPLNAASGVDVLNVNNSHLMLTALEQNGSATVPATSNVTVRGWDFGTITDTGTLYYRFNLAGVTDQLSFLCAWNRNVNTSFTGFTQANFNLQLFRVNCSNQLLSLVGDANASIFSGGNVVSQSGIENVEHLFIRNLQPGKYVLRVNRSDAIAQAWDVGVAWLIPPPTSLPHPGDVSGNGVTNVDDLLAVINAWGTCTGICPADIAPAGGNCVINVDDLLAVINGWG